MNTQSRKWIIKELSGEPGYATDLGYEFESYEAAEKFIIAFVKDTPLKRRDDFVILRVA